VSRRDRSASVTTVVAEASAEQVYAVLADPRAPGYYVVGTSHVRRFDPRWPEAGTALHFSAGIGPFKLRDRSTVVESRPPHHLVLDAQLRPLGALRIEFEVRELPAGPPHGPDVAPQRPRTEVTLREWPERGLIASPGLRRLASALIDLRNKELTRRLRLLAERRRAQAEAQGA
jgi:hypothetical protein